MKYINKTLNPAGYYSVIQEQKTSILPEGCAKWPDDLDTIVFYEYNGFVTLNIENDVVLNYAPNIIAWEEYKASIPEPQAEEPSTDEVLNALIGYVGYEE